MLARRKSLVRIEVKLFAGARHGAGRSAVTVELPASATIADLKRAIAAECPEIAPLVASSRIALDGAYVTDAVVVRPGAEVAVIPPVSGGGDSGEDEARPMVEITAETIDVGAVLARVRSNQAGAVCLFLGTVREMTAGKRTVRLEYEAYPAMARDRIVAWIDEARVRWPVVAAAVSHRVGVLELGDVAVAVAVSGPHRAEAFEACRWLMDSIKHDVPIWKKEEWDDGREEWSHPGLDSTPGA
jgi:molybdopterin synthase catalytic subunit